MPAANRHGFEFQNGIPMELLPRSGL